MTGPLADPAISVIIPHLNQEQALERCLAALASQRGFDRPFEVIVVDNGSGRTPEALCARYPAVRLVCESVPGPGPARNRGTQLAQAETFAFIDADCVADPTWLSAIHEAFHEPARRILGGEVRIAVDNPKRLTLLESYESVYAYRQRLYIERHGFSGTGNLAVRKKDFETIGPFAGLGVAEDLEWGRRAQQLGYQIHFVPEMIVAHPARKTFRELIAKWDRHIAHAFEASSGTRWPRSRWALYALGVAASPLVEPFRVFTTPRLGSFRERVLALRGVTRIRLYRARLMFSLLMGKDAATLTRSWNRDPRGEKSSHHKGDSPDA